MACDSCAASVCIRSEQGRTVTGSKMVCWRLPQSQPIVQESEGVRSCHKFRPVCLHDVTVVTEFDASWKLRKRDKTVYSGGVQMHSETQSVVKHPRSGVRGTGKCVGPRAVCDIAEAIMSREPRGGSE